MGLQWVGFLATHEYDVVYEGPPCECNADYVEIRAFRLSVMSEISKDGFWQMVEGEWVPTEKQLEAIKDGAIGHDDEIVQQKITVSDSPEYSTSQLEFTSSESQFTGTEEYVAFLGYVLIGIGVLDFLLSFTGTNITFFLGFLSSFTPILFGVAGGALIGAKEEIKSFRMDRFSESNVAKGIYAGTVVLGLVLVGTLGVMSNHSNPEIVGEWYGVYDTIEFQSNGKTTHTSSTDASIEEWRIDDNDLLLVWSDEPEYEYYYKYQITGSHLFVAGYNDDFETIANDGCWVMSSDKDGKNENYWNNVNLSLPEWCNY